MNKTVVSYKEYNAVKTDMECFRSQYAKTIKVIEKLQKENQRLKDKLNKSETRQANRLREERRMIKS